MRHLLLMVAVVVIDDADDDEIANELAGKLIDEEDSSYVRVTGVYVERTGND